LFFGFVVGADPWAHRGGFAAGAALGLVLRPHRIHGTRLAAVLGAVGLLALSAIVWAALIPR
jgi:hypothetical protein